MSVISGRWDMVRSMTYIHVEHVLQDIVTKLLAGKARQFIRDGILALTSNESVMLLPGLSLGTQASVILHEEGLTGLVARTRTKVIHDESGWTRG